MLLLTSNHYAPPNKPNWPFGINWDSPQADGLAVWIPFVDGCGYVLPMQRSTAGQRRFRVNVTGGYGADFNATDHNVATYPLNASPFLTNQGMTVVWMGALDQVAASMPLVITNTSHQAANTPFNFRTGGIDAAGFALNRGAAATANEYSTAGSILTANTFYVLAASCANELIQTPPLFFWNGNSSTPVAGPNTGAVTASGQDLRIGGDFFVWNSDYYVSEVRIYNRGLKYSELYHIWDRTTRFDLYWSPSSIAFFDLAQGGGGGGAGKGRGGKKGGGGGPVTASAGGTLLFNLGFAGDINAGEG